MAKNYVVKALAAIVNIEGGIAQMLHRGAPVPSNVKPDHLQHLLDQDLVEEGEPVGGLEPVYSGDLRDKVTEAAKPAEPAAEDPDGPGPIPPKSANKDAWVAYAVTQRADGVEEAAAKADAEALTKDELVAKFGA